VGVIQTKSNYLTKAITISLSARYTICLDKSILLIFHMMIQCLPFLEQMAMYESSNYQKSL